MVLKGLRDLYVFCFKRYSKQQVSTRCIREGEVAVLDILGSERELRVVNP
jgi:hypothetical protein